VDTNYISKNEKKINWIKHATVSNALCSKSFLPEENDMLAGGHYGSSVPFMHLDMHTPSHNFSFYNASLP